MRTSFTASWTTSRTPSSRTIYDTPETLFWADTLYMTDPALIRALIESPASTVNFDSWFLFDLDLDGGQHGCRFFPGSAPS